MYNWDPFLVAVRFGEALGQLDSALAVDLAEGEDLAAVQPILAVLANANSLFKPKGVVEGGMPPAQHYRARKQCRGLHQTSVRRLGHGDRCRREAK